MLRFNTDPKYKMDQPILISVITIDDTDLMPPNIMERTNTLAARFGVFSFAFQRRITIFVLHCSGDTRQKHSRTHRYNLERFFVPAVQLCSYLRELSDIIETALQYEYLGPHCCKMKNCAVNVRYCRNTAAQAFPLYFFSLFTNRS